MPDIDEIQLHLGILHSQVQVIDQKIQKIRAGPWIDQAELGQLKLDLDRIQFSITRIHEVHGHLLDGL